MNRLKLKLLLLLVLSTLKGYNQIGGGVNTLLPIQCNPNSFWINYYIPNTLNKFDILEYDMTGSTLTVTDTVLKQIDYPALSYGNDLTLGNGKTFYSVVYDIQNYAVKYNGFNWDTLPNFGQLQFHNCAGHDSILIFDAGDSINAYMHQLYRFNGNTFNLIYSADTGKCFSFEDISVDIFDNIWFFISYNGNREQPLYLSQIDKYGNLIKNYFISVNSVFNSKEGFGSFIFDNKLYMGVGYTNAYSNSLLPFEIIGDSVYMDMPIPLNCGQYQPLDAESCNQGSLTALPPSIIDQSHSLFCYPNPATEFVKIYGNYEMYKTEVTDINGMLIEVLNDQQNEIDIRKYVNGLYFIKSTSKNGAVRTGRFIKM